MEAVPIANSHHPLFCDISTGTQRPIVPLPWRRAVFDSLHGLSHPGIRATQKLITARFVWPGINADVRRWTRSCIQCQRAKIQRHTATPLSTFPTPDVRFDVVHIDLVGPLPPSQGFSYLLTCVDRFTRWPEAIPIPDITAETVAQAFLRGWIARFGVPSTIITGRGRQFESQIWNKLMSLLGSKRARTTAYHPQTNGMVERFHRQLKAALKAQTNSAAWMDTLPLILLESEHLSKRISRQQLLKWFMVLPFAYLENFSPPLQQRLRLTHPTLFRNLNRISKQCNPLLPDRLNAPLTSPIICLQQHACSFVMMVFVSLYSHLTMDPFQSFHKQTFHHFDTWSQRYVSK